MGLLDTLLGRTPPVAPNLDTLFAVPAAAIALQAALDLTPTGTGSVCFTTAEGAAATRVLAEITGLLGESVVSVDEYGYTWVTCHRAPDQLAELVTDLHAANTALTDAGLGPSLLCTTIGFTGADDTRLTLVYLYKRGTVYPFCPSGHRQRDTALELSVRAELEHEIAVEPELDRWYALWNTPGDR